MREATGLVRELSLFDSFVVNFGAAPIVESGFIVAAWGFWLLPGANIPLSMILSAVLLMCGLAFVYAIFAATMPRSGGDYVYISRGLHPALGFAGNFTQLYTNQAFFAPSVTYTQLFIIDTLVSTGLLAKNTGLVDVGFALNSPLWTWIVGTITIVSLGLVALWGTKKLMRVCAVLFVLTLVGILVALAGLIAFDPSKFVPLFNNFMQSYTSNPDTYHTVIKDATDAGLQIPSGWSLTESMKFMPIYLSVAAYSYWFTYMGGEFKSASSVKRQYASIGGATVALVAITVMIIWLIENAAGHEFLSSMFYLYTNVPGALPIPVAPYLSLFAGIMTNNALIAAIVGIGVTASGVLLTAILYPMITRVLFAYSFDRLLPSKLADVNERFGTPHVAIVVATVVGVIWLTFYQFLSPQLFVYITLGTVYSAIVFDFGLVSIAAICFPFLKRRSYDISPAKKYEVAGIPLMTIAGVIGMMTIAYAGIGYFTDPAYGIVGTPWLEAHLLGMFFVPLIAFYLIRAYRKRQGIDIDLLFKEIPPE